MLLSPRLKGISKNLYLFGTREEDHRLILEEELEPGARVLDIGANIGYYALMEAMLVGPSGKVFAVEPDPRNLDLLGANIELNDLQSRIPVFNLAVSNRGGSRPFIRVAKSNLNYLAPSFDEAPAGGGFDVMEVRTVEIADLLREIGKVHLLRMDIEGQEVDIFEGLLRLLRIEPNLAPDKIIFEVHTWKYPDFKLGMAEQLRGLFEHGYRVKTLATDDEEYSPPRDAGYPARRLTVSDFHWRGIYRDIKDADAMNFICETGGIRTVLLSRA